MSAIPSLAGEQLQFLGDCTHALAGRTVDLPGWEVWTVFDRQEAKRSGSK